MIGQEREQAIEEAKGLLLEKLADLKMLEGQGVDVSSLLSEKERDYFDLIEESETIISELP